MVNYYRQPHTLQTKGITIKFIKFDTIDSTQLWAINNLDSFDLTDITCISAKQQSTGIGTKGRSWFSPPGNMYTTFVFKAEQHMNLAQIMSLSLLEVLKKHSISVQLKWPNDIMLGSKKLGGALCNIKNDIALLGIGMNVNCTNLDHIDQPATSLQIKTGKTWDVDTLIEKLAYQFESDLKLGYAALYPKYVQSMPYLGRAIEWPGGTGTAIQVCPDGRLEIETDGKRIKISEGSFIKNQM